MYHKLGGVRAFIIILCLDAVLSAGGNRSAVAAPSNTAPEDERLLYAFKFDGLRFGDVLITLHESDVGYSSELRGRARGLMKFFSDFRADLSGEGHFGDSLPVYLKPDEFRRAWSVGHWASITTVAFDPATHLAVSQERLFNPATGEDLPPPHRRRVPPPVPEAKRTDVLDPMTAVIAGRDLIRKNWNDAEAAQAEYRLPVFDGRHRYDVVIKPGPVRNEKIDGVIQQVVPVAERVEPTAGFEADMAAHAREGKGSVLFSADERFLPLVVVVGNSLGKGTFTLITDCRSDPAPCDAVDEASRVQGMH